MISSTLFLERYGLIVDRACRGRPLRQNFGLEWTHFLLRVYPFLACAPQRLNKEGENVSYPLSSFDKCFAPRSDTG